MGLALIDSILDTFFPRFCVRCGRRLILSESSVCAHCLMELPRFDGWDSPADNLLVRRYWGRGEVSEAVAYLHLLPHTSSADIVYQFKYHDRPDVARDMGRLMAQEMAQFFKDKDVLVPVPLSRSRYIDRGYNQAEELARGISAVTGMPVCGKALKRIKFKGSQTRLSDLERMENTERAFELTKYAESLKGRHVVLVDDVITTGSTTLACAGLLSKIEGVTVSVVAFGFVR